MTLIAPQPIVSRPSPVPVPRRGSRLLDLLRTTDHKTIGVMYLFTSFLYFFAGGFMALLMRAELARPGLQFLSPEQYNQLLTMHGTIMLLLFATPLVFGFANLVLPLQIGAPDVAFPRLNSFSYWLYLFGSLIVMASFLTPAGAPDFGWYAYAPRATAAHPPGVGANLWIVGLIVAGLGTILGAVNMLTTIVCLRAPGMTMFRMPIFTWSIFVTSILILVAFPALTATLFALLADRQLGALVYSRENGGGMLWQHLFWFFGHPEVYIVALPFFGIVSEVVPVFSRKPLFGYKGMVFALFGIGFLSFSVWALHMFATGAVLLPFFSFLTYLIAIPTGIKFFNWIGTMWRGPISFETPMLFAGRFPSPFPPGRLPPPPLAGRGAGGVGGHPAAGLAPQRQLLRRRALPLRRLRHRRLLRVRRSVLLVPEDVRPDDGREARQAPLLADLHRVPHHVPHPALAGQRGHATPVCGLPADRRRRQLHRHTHGVDDRRVHPRRLDDPV